MSKNVDDFLACAFSQGQRLNDPSISYLFNSILAQAAHDGVCQALAQFWIQHKLKELRTNTRKSPQERMALLTNEVLVDAMDLFASFGGNSHLRVGMGAKKYDLLCHRSEGLCSYTGQHGNKTLIDTVTGEKNACYLINFSFKKSAKIGSHAIACYCSSGKVLGAGRHVYLFDPNHGEYKVPKSDFRSWWWQKFMKEKYNVQYVGETGNHYEIYPFELAPAN